jgi:hypothetical protein
MKTFCFALVMGLFCSVSQVNAQHVEFGLKGGLNVSNIHSSPGTEDYNARASVYAGGLAHIHLSEHIAIQPELVYSSQGTKSTLADVNYTLRLNYINIPVLFQYMVGDGFRLQTGPQLGLLAGAKVNSGGTTKDVKGDYTTGDFSWAVGASYLTPMGLGFDARFNFGLSNINNTSTNAGFYNRVFQLGLFYQFKHPTADIQK